MTSLPFVAVIPAAGSSSRMEHFKPLLRVNGQTLIQRAISVFRQNRIDDIIVVVGHRAVDLEAALIQDEVRIIHFIFKVREREHYEFDALAKQTKTRWTAECPARADIEALSNRLIS